MLEWITNIDFAILDFIARNISNPVLDLIFRTVTALGNGGIFWIILTVVLLLFKDTRRAGVTMAIALLIDLIICNLTLKPLIARIRPYDINTSVSLIISPPTDYSFPSGHTASSFAAALSLFFYNRKYGAAAIALACVIALSRLYLYVHYPTDVLAGAAIGVLCAYAAFYLSKLMYKDPSRSMSK